MKLSLKKWIDTNGVRLIHIKDPCKYKYILPKMYNKEDMCIWEADQKRFEGGLLQISPQYVGITKNLFCCSDGSVKSNDSVIEDFSEHNELRSMGQVQNTSEEVYVNLADRWCGDNYWHWMTTSLSRLYLLQRLESFTSFNDYLYIVNSLKHRFIRESLLKFGIVTNSCIEVGDDNASIYCQNVILPSRIHDEDIDSILYLRNNLRHSTPDGINKVYISRTGTRKILNEDEVIDVLSKRNFVSVQPENLSFYDQVSLFSGASVIVGPHGSGMTNILFAPDNAKVLEIRNRNYNGNCYLWLSNKLGFDYYNLYGVGQQIDSYGQFSSNVFGDIFVDKKDLINTLDMMEV